MHLRTVARPTKLVVRGLERTGGRTEETGVILSVNAPRRIERAPIFPTRSDLCPNPRRVIPALTLILQ